MLVVLAAEMHKCLVTNIRPFEGGVELETPQGRFICRKLIVTAGGWMDKLLAKIGLSLRITVTGEVATKIGLDASAPAVDLDRRDFLLDPNRAFRVNRPAISDPNYPPSFRTS